jgi:sugar phosphate isomerase/epimerase
MTDQELNLAAAAAALSADVRTAPTLARKAGVSGLLFDARTRSLDFTDLSNTGTREFVHVLSAQGQQLVGLRHDAGAKGFGFKSDIDRELSRLQRVMEAAKKLGAPVVCVDIGPLPAPARTEPVKPKVTPELAGMILLPETTPPKVETVQAAAPDPALISQIDAALVELGRLADRTSCMLAFRSELSPLSALERALRAADCPWFGVDLDPVAVLGDEWDLDETFSRLGPHVRHVRGRDALKGTERRTKAVPVGQGDTDWSQLLANLREADYRGWITMDPLELSDRAGAVAAATRFLKSIR